jgi:hypothetical protein
VISYLAYSAINQLFDPEVYDKKFVQKVNKERPMAWQLVVSVLKEPGLVWKHKVPHEVKDQVNGLFFVSDSTVSYGIGTDSAAHSALLCYEKVLS